MTPPDPRDLDWWGRELERHARRASVAVAQRDAYAADYAEARELLELERANLATVTLERDAIARELEQVRQAIAHAIADWTSPDVHEDHRHGLRLAATMLSTRLGDV